MTSPAVESGKALIRRIDSAVEPPQETDPLVAALRSLFGTTSVVFSVATDDGTAVPLAHYAARPAVSPATRTRLGERLLAYLTKGGEEVGDNFLAVTLQGWDLAMAVARAGSDQGAAAVAVARPTREGVTWSPGEILTIRAFARLGAPRLVPADEAPVTASAQPGLDAIVTRIAVKLMSVSSDSLDESLEWTLRVLSEFFKVDTSFLRGNDFDREMTVLVAEWPRRHDVPIPDPLGEVPFGADPVFDATRDLVGPFVMRPTDSAAAYQERVHEGSGVAAVSMAMVPLVRCETTVGVLGFVKFGDRPWSTAETNALEAVASLIAQLQGRVDAEDRLLYQAHHDDLTGLYNRRALIEELDRRLSKGDAPTTALLLVDLDRFKALNDAVGRVAGDQLLVAVAGRLRNAARPDDFVARMSGGEFALLIERPTIELEALAVSDWLLELVAMPVRMGSRDVSRTASLGVAFGSGWLQATDDLLAHAGAALRVAKAQGGNRAAVFDEPMRLSVTQRADTELQLRNAIDYGGLVLHYQPEFDLRTGQLLAVEALLRWNHPERGLLAAAAFITLAEETGLIVDVDRWVLAEACRQAADWRHRYPQLHLTMRVNMSPAQFATRNVVRLVKECLAKNQLPGSLLCLEITEHAVMQDVEEAVQVLHELKSVGVSFAIDDFGTGHSSMSQLKRLPVDALKVDQTFVAGLGTDGRDHAIVGATIGLAQSFGLDVVAEGVETPDIVRELLSLGCFRAQGYLLSRPKAAADLIPILRRGGVDPAAFNRRDHLSDPAPAAA
jgi:diguanylate cyclase (GGDEF)-like protein